MTPGISRLESQALTEATVNPKLKGIVRGVTRRLRSYDGAKSLVNPVSGNQIADRIRIVPLGVRNLLSGAQYHRIIGDLFPPDVCPVIPYVRGFEHRILQDFVRDSEVPLPALGRAEVNIGRKQLGLYIRSLQPGVDGIQAAADWTIG